MLSIVVDIIFMLIRWKLIKVTCNFCTIIGVSIVLCEEYLTFAKLVILNVN